MLSFFQRKDSATVAREQREAHLLGLQLQAAANRSQEQRRCESPSLVVPAPASDDPSDSDDEMGAVEAKDIAAESTDVCNLDYGPLLLALLLALLVLPVFFAPFLLVLLHV